MTKIRVTKIEAAQRQLDAAIRMLFGNEDPVAIHTLAMAGFRILRDLAVARGDSDMETQIDRIILPGRKASFWGAMHGFSNFLKHADRDPEGIYDGVDESVNDISLFIAVLYYGDLQKHLTPEMLTLSGWYSALHPDHVFSDVTPSFRTAIDAAGAGLRTLSRADQLEFCQTLIPIAKKCIQENQ